MHFRGIVSTLFFAIMFSIHAMELEPLFGEIDAITKQPLDEMDIISNNPNETNVMMPLDVPPDAISRILYTWRPTSKVLELVGCKNEKTQKREIPCRSCNYIGCDYKSTKNHILQKHKDDNDLINSLYPFTCNACKKLFSKIGTIRKHLINKHDISTEEWKKHEQDRINDANSASEMDTKPLFNVAIYNSSEFLYTWHPTNKALTLACRKNIETKKLEFPCPLLDFVSCDYKSTKRHIFIAHPDSDLFNRIYSYKCSKCTESYATLGAMKNHLMKTHKVSLEAWQKNESARLAKFSLKPNHKKFLCTCGNISSKQDAFQRHLSVCDSQRLGYLYPNECEQCGKRFKKGNLEQHRKSKSCKK